MFSFIELINTYWLVPGDFDLSGHFDEIPVKDNCVRFMSDRIFNKI